MNPFGSMQQSDPNFKRAFGDTRMSLAHVGLALLDPLDQGWVRGTVNNILTPVMLPKSSVPLAPDYISTMIKCSCEN